MPVRALVWRSYYQDSVVLMRVAESVRALPGVREAAVLMGTAANRDLLASAGLLTPETTAVSASDLIIAVDAKTEADAAAALETAKSLFEQRRRAHEAAGRVFPRTLDSALRQIPDANLVAISVPGAYAKLEAMRALRRGLHVFLFSDNVSLADEIELKRFAVRRRLLCMGPDCGTAYLNGIGLGFANVVPRGRVGCVSASGTGLQAVASHLAALGEGISHGIGVGGQDLSAEVGGLMTKFALEALAADSATEVIVLISKPPAESVMVDVLGAIEGAGKPVVVCCLGAAARGDGSACWVTTLEDAAQAAAALRRGQLWTGRVFSETGAVVERLAPIWAERSLRGPGLLGLYTGGTLAHEARVLLEPLLGAVSSNVGAARGVSPHHILDLGADEFTVGRPHPMLDPEARAGRVRDAGRSGDVGVLLVDLVLGRAAHPDPARALAAAIRDARATAAQDGRSLLVVGSAVGTERDPQGLGGQVAALEGAGALVLPSNAQAARCAALVLKPDLRSRLLGDVR